VEVVNADGSGSPTRLTTAAGFDGDPAWSPDGSKIAFSTQRGGTPEVWLMDGDGGNQHAVTAGTNPEWSPGGERLAVERASGGSQHIYSVAADGSDAKQVTRAAVAGETTIEDDPAWSPDGTRIAFAADVNGPLQEELFIMNADGTNVVRTGIDVATTLDWSVAPAAPVVPPPVTGVNVNVTPVSGTVLVRLKGTTTFVPVTARSSVPVGSELDLTKGRIQLTSTAAGGTTQTAVFYQGRALVAQATAAAPVTTLTLSGPLKCPKRKTSAVAAPKTRSLWGNGKGNFRTNGRYAAATVRGTFWLTQDTCKGTLVSVRSGTVSVLDRVRHRTVSVKAGKSYLALAKR
jgi:hypothetical protein